MRESGKVGVIVAGADWFLLVVGELGLFAWPRPGLEHFFLAFFLFPFYSRF